MYWQGGLVFAMQREINMQTIPYVDVRVHSLYSLLLPGGDSRFVKTVSSRAFVELYPRTESFLSSSHDGRKRA